MLKSERRKLVYDKYLEAYRGDAEVGRCERNAGDRSYIHIYMHTCIRAKVHIYICIYTFIVIDQ